MSSADVIDPQTRLRQLIKAYANWKVLEAHLQQRAYRALKARGCWWLRLHQLSPVKPEELCVAVDGHNLRVKYYDDYDWSNTTRVLDLPLMIFAVTVAEFDAWCAAEDEARQRREQAEIDSQAESEREREIRQLEELMARYPDAVHR
jgi:hypothetical protein